MRNFIKRLLEQVQAREEGQTVVEYAVVVGIIVVGMVALWNNTPIQTALNSLIGNITSLI